MTASRFVAATAVALSITLCSASTAHAADEFGALQVPAAAQDFTVGALKLTALQDMQFVLPNDGKVVGMNAGPEAVAGVLKGASLPTDRVSLSVSALLVRTGKRVVLIDSGLGATMKGGLAASLAKAGVKPEQVTDVLITHAHFDHVGGTLGADGKPAFPNATIRMTAAEWAWMQERKDTAALAKSIAAKVQTFEPGKPVAPGITPVVLAGHTPGHVGYELASNGKRLLDIGDLAHHSVVSLGHPEWRIQFDNDPATAEKTRRAELTTLAKDGEWVFSPHFPYPGVGRVVTSGDGFAWQPGLPK
jgi:glyoxylase-like metal-dependent hydrolase (beta-lactamase superfamily II)